MHISSYEQEHAWIQTYTNKKFHILAPTPEEIDIVDIAHALAHLCRFTGHTDRFYSVAEHSWHASRIAPQHLALEALLHDAPEAYIGDMNRPLKHFTEAGALYREVEEQIEKAISEKFNLQLPSPEVKRVDDLMVYAEKRQLMKDMPWSRKWGATTEAATITIVGFSPIYIKDLFIHRFDELMAQRIIQ